MPATTIASLSMEFKTELRKLNSSIDEMKNLIHSQNTELAVLKENMESMVTERAELKSQVAALEQELKSRIDDQDQYERKDSLILSGPAVTDMVPDENTHELVKKLVNDHLGINQYSGHFNITHRLGPLRRSSNGSANPKRNIYVKLVRRDLKKAIVTASKSQRNSQLYANESLTPYRRKMFHALRRMKKNVETVKGCTTLDGRIYAFTAPLPNQTRDQRHHIKDMEAHHEFCRQFVKRPIDSFLVNFGDT